MKVDQDVWLSPDKKSIHVGDNPPNGSTLLANGGGEATVEDMKVRAPDIPEEKLRAALRGESEEKSLQEAPEDKALRGPRPSTK